MADHEHVWHGDRPSNVRCGLQGCDAKPRKADVEKVRQDTAARRAIRQTILFTHKRPER